MARVSSYLIPDRQSDYALLAFPEKLWWIVNNPKRDEIHWNVLGTCIVIPNTQRFISEVLNNPSNGLFKTKHFASFVRQLNLYGFRKVTEYGKRTISPPFSVHSKCEFKHPYFRKGRQDLLVHVKRQQYSSKKPDNKRQANNHIPSSTKPELNQPTASTSVSSSWNSTLYTPMPFVPLQTSLHMPFTLYAPFYNAYQLAQMQQGPVVGLSNAQGLGLPGQFPQGPPSPTLSWAQNLGHREENLKPVSSFVPMQSEARNAGIVSFRETLPAEAVKSQDIPLSPTVKKSMATAIPVSTTDTNIQTPITKCRETATLTRDQEHTKRAIDTKYVASTVTNSISAQGSVHAIMKEPAETTGSCWQTFTVNAIPKELAVKPFVPVSKSMMPRGNSEMSLDDNPLLFNRGLVNDEKVVSNGTKFSKEFVHV